MASIIESFDLYGPMPNFTRDRLDTLESLRSVNPWTYDIGHIVYCKETKKHYVFRGNKVEFDEELGYFREFIPDTSILEERIKSNEEKIDAIEIPDITPLEERIKSNEEKIDAIEIPDITPLEERIKSNEEKIDAIEIPDITPLEEQLSTNTEQIADNTNLINMLYNREFPITSSLTVYDVSTNKVINSIYKVGTVLRVKLIMSIKQNNAVVSNNRIAKMTISLNNDTLYDGSPISSYVIEKDINTNSTITISYTLIDGSKTSSSKSVKFGTESYFGIVGDDVSASTVQISQADSIGLMTSRGYTRTVTQDNQKNYYAYPSSYGKLVSIKDAKNYELIDSYEYGARYIDGVGYNIYILKHASTVDNYKLVFS